VRNHDEPINLLVARIGEGEIGPIGTGLAGWHFDAAHNSVAARRG
jgi:hypothetical protein